MELSGSFLYSDETYPDDVDNRKDDRFEFGAGLDYKFYKYLVVGASYSYSKRDSNLDVNDFSDHIALMKIRGIM